MPGKFVTRAAERAGVSIETAEHRWKEAKAKVHKGKRRGSWYWGKVMNTFKRMMGLMENVTLKEWMLFESEHVYSTWPDEIHLYGPYVAVKIEELERFVRYQVEMLMGEPTGITLHASVIMGGPYEHGSSFIVSLHGDSTQGLGINVPKNESTPEEFKKWAIEAMKTKPEKLGLTEGLHPPPFKKLVDHLPETIYIGKGVTAELLGKRPDNWAYHLRQLMTDEPIGMLMLFRRKPNLWMAVHKMNETGGAGVMVKVEQVDQFTEEQIKKFVLANPPINLAESKQSDNLKAKGWHEFTVEPISGQWPQSRGDLWRALDSAFGADDWQVMDVNEVHKHKWKNNLPVTYVHHPETTPDLKVLKAAGFRIRFLPD